MPQTHESQALRSLPWLLSNRLVMLPERLVNRALAAHAVNGNTKKQDYRGHNGSLSNPTEHSFITRKDY